MNVDPVMTNKALAALLPEARHSIDRGLDFLESAITAAGVWDSRYYSVTNPAELHLDNNPFVGALGSLVLMSCEDERSVSIVSRSKEHVMRTMEYPGLWRYWPHLPFDIDTTSICSLAAGMHPWLLAGASEAAIIANRSDSGPLHTWITGGEIECLDADAIANANALAYLGDRPATRTIRDWLIGLIETGEEEEAIHYYWDKIDLYSALARAIQLHPEFLGENRSLLLSRLSASRNDDGSYGDQLRTALALLALFVLDAPPPASELSDSLRKLMRMQQQDGGWKASPLSSGPFWPDQREFVFVSRAYDTACCIALLNRVTGPAPKFPGRNRPRA